MKRKNNSDWLRFMVRYSNMAFQMLVIIGGGIAGGVYADRHFNFTFPLFTLLASFVSVGLAIYISIKDLIK